MSKNLRNFLIVLISIILIAFGISYGYNKYQERETEKTVKILTDVLIGKEVLVKEKSLFTRLKEKLFGTEEEKIIEELNKKYEELLAFEDKFYGGLDEIGKKKIKEGFESLSNEISKLQDKYYSLTGENYIYETETSNASNKVEGQERVKLQKEEIVSEKTNVSLSPEEAFKSKVKNKYIEQGYTLEETSFFQKFKTFFGANKTEDLVSENGSQIKIAYDKNKALIEEYNADKLVRTIEYKTEDDYQTIQVKIEDKEKNLVRTLENMDNGYGLDEYKDGSKVEFKHKAMVPNGTAVRYYANGDREEFIYHDGIRNGFSTYYFTNGDKEEVYYKDDKLEGKARYIYADGYVETTQYKNGQRVD